MEFSANGKVISELKLLAMQEAYSAHSPTCYRLCTYPKYHRKALRSETGWIFSFRAKTRLIPSEVDAKHTNQDKLLHKNSQEREYIK